MTRLSLILNVLVVKKSDSEIIQVLFAVILLTVAVGKYLVHTDEHFHWPPVFREIP